MIVAFNSSGTGFLHLCYVKVSHVASSVCFFGCSLGFFCPKLPLSIFFKSELNGLLKLHDCTFINCGCNALQEVRLDNQDNLLVLHDSMQTFKMSQLFSLDFLGDSVGAKVNKNVH